jgi:hypothetical protein
VTKKKIFSSIYVFLGLLLYSTLTVTYVIKPFLNVFNSLVLYPNAIEQRVLDTDAGKQLTQAATDV